MNLNDLVSEIYKKLNNTKYFVNGWAIIDDTSYNKIKNKILINNINNITINNHNEYTCLLESKSKYYFIKWNNRFISIVESETEYGLLLNNINIFAINTLAITNNKIDNNIHSPKEILKIIGFKLNKKVKSNLDYFA
jgi:hypothetical protein